MLLILSLSEDCLLRVFAASGDLSAFTFSNTFFSLFVLFFSFATDCMLALEAGLAL